MKTEVIVRATRTQNVLGEKGRRIRELTSLIQKRCVEAALAGRCVRELRRTAPRGLADGPRAQLQLPGERPGAVRRACGQPRPVRAGAG